MEDRVIKHSNNEQIMNSIMARHSFYKRNCFLIFIALYLNY
jgi:hypothetical protein